MILLTLVGVIGFTFYLSTFGVILGLFVALVIGVAFGAFLAIVGIDTVRREEDLR
jgi:hypothetical protein